MSRLARIRRQHRADLAEAITGADETEEGTLTICLARVVLDLANQVARLHAVPETETD